VGGEIDDPSDGNVVDVVPCRALSDTPAAVGANCVTSGLSNTDSELVGSISNCSGLGADGSTRLSSIGAWINVDGTSELDWTAAALDGCWFCPVMGFGCVGVNGLLVLGLVGVSGLDVSV